ncbi:MAG: DNA polymerase Y family protein, partial [Desulfosalsimonas sp.]
MGRVLEREVVHLNIADFAAAVERVHDPSLNRRPVIIAPAGGRRAGVYDMSEEAYQAGVRKGMPLYRARRQCRDAAVLAPRLHRYAQAMARVVRRVMPYSPLIEPGEMDGHLFVDITGTGRLHGPARDAARGMARQVRDHLGFCPAWAVASNKLVAKVATRVVKPAGQCLVAPGDEAGFLSPLGLDLIPGISRDHLFRLR